MLKYLTKSKKREIANESILVLIKLGELNLTVAIRDEIVIKLRELVKEL